MEEKKIQRAKAWAVISMVIGILLTIAIKLITTKHIYIIGVGALTLNLMIFAMVNIKVSKENLEGSTPNKLIIIYNTLVRLTLLLLLIIALSATPH